MGKGGRVIPLEPPLDPPMKYRFNQRANFDVFCFDCLMIHLLQMSHLMKFWYLSHMRASKAQNESAHLRRLIRASVAGRVYEA